MKITKRQLQRIIKEATVNVIREQSGQRMAGITIASVDQHIQPLKDMIEQHIVGDHQISLEAYDRALTALSDLESILQKIAEGGSGAPLR